MVSYRQVSTILFTNANQVAEQTFAIQRILADAHQGAFQPPKEKNSFKLDTPVKVPLGELDSAYTGLVFPESEPKKPDLSSLVMDSTIPQEVRERILLAVEMSH